MRTVKDAFSLPALSCAHRDDGRRDERRDAENVSFRDGFLLRFGAILLLQTGDLRNGKRYSNRA
jgi:hypothetical protein